MNKYELTDYLAVAFKYNNYKKAEELLMQGADVNGCSNEVGDDYRVSYLPFIHVAIQQNYLDMLKLLLKYNVDISARDNFGKTVLTALDNYIALYDNYFGSKTYTKMRNLIIEHEANK